MRTVILIIFIFFPIFLFPQIKYVKSGAVGTGNSWADATGNLQTAITSGATQVWVAAGTYFPGGARTNFFALASGVAVYGGFAAVGNPTFGERNPDIYLTVLSADIGTAGVATDNCYHVIQNTVALDQSTTIVDGFTISGGYANGGGANNDGGAARFTSGASATFNNCIFSNNYAQDDGGAIIANNSLPVFTNCKFISNSANDDGGAIRLETNAHASFNNCSFENNSGNVSDSDGGAIAAESGSSPTFSNCSFIGNISHNRGGVIYVTGATSLVSFNSCSFTNNTSDGLANSRGFGGVFYITNSTGGINISNCTFTANIGTTTNGSATCGSGGVGYITGTSYNISNSVFANNTSNYYGGVLYCNNIPNTAKFFNNLMYKNNANYRGGALYLTGTNLPSIHNNTFVYNTAVDRAGAFYNDNGNPIVRSCIFWGNSSADQNNVYRQNGTPDFNYCNVQGGKTWGGGTYGGSNINSDPFFNDVATDDYSLQIKTDTQTQSPCYNVGDPSLTVADIGNFDVAGNVRIIETTPDIGAYEIQNNQPYTLTLDNIIIDEELGIGTAVGILDADDIDVLQTMTYSLVAGANDTHNAYFQIAGNQLQVGANIDYELPLTTCDIRLRVTDNGNPALFFENVFTITINNKNDKPIITSGAPTATVLQDVAYVTYTFTATDPEGTAIVYSASTLPSWMSFDPVTGELTGTPQNDDVGIHNVTLRATDNNGPPVDPAPASKDFSFTIEVIDVNDLPVITEGATVTVNIDEDSNPTAFALTLNATDTDVPANTLTWSISLFASNGVAIANGIGNSTTIDYTPDPNYFGVDVFNVRISDGNGGGDEIIVNVNIAPVNDDPEFTSSPIIAAKASRLYSYNIIATDIDNLGTDLDFACLSKPAWLNFTDNGDGTALLSGIPAESDLGDSFIEITVTDNVIAVPISQSYTLTVRTSLIVIPTDYPTIQEGIDAADTDDVVLVLAGNYYENINFNGQAVELQGNPADPSAVVLYGNGTSSIVTFENGETCSSKINGITFKNGSGSRKDLRNISKHNVYGNYGGAIYCSNSSPCIYNSVIKNNQLSAVLNQGASGAGAFICNNSHPMFENVVFENNSVEIYRGGAICIMNSEIDLNNCTLQNNDGGNYGGGIAAYFSTINLNNSNIINNVASGSNGEGGGIYLHSSTLNASGSNVNTNTATKSGNNIAEFD